MKLLVFASIIGLAFGLPPTIPVPITNYHSTIGIKKAALIKAAEEASDFDGTRIIGGSPAQLGDYPYFAGLIIELQGGWLSVCGSALLSNTKLVSAAHCYYEGSAQVPRVTAVLGSVTLFSGGTRYITTNLIVHEYWNTNSILNNIAIVTIPWVTFSDTISSIALPSGALLNQDFTGISAQTAGFGVQSGQGNIVQSQRLHHISLSVINNDDCYRIYGAVVSTTHLCAATSVGGSPCEGDAGAPLAISSGRRNVLIGVSSFGAGTGCNLGLPVGYSRITHYAPWIQSLL